MTRTAKAMSPRGEAADPYSGLKDRDYFHIMLNLDSFDGFLPTARALAENYLQAARKRQQGSELEAELRPFPYTEAVLDARMDQVYQGLVDDVTQYEATQGWLQRTKDDVVDWMLQMAPFNQTDGAWLRMIADVGPMDAVRSLLFSIYADELGGGDPDLNHPNLYTKLLRSAGLDLPAIRSRAYADNPAIVDAAFTQPLFQLVVSQFPQDYLPELLGMTLYLEWSSVELQNMVLLNRHFGLDAEFYEIHVAIDNAATGHGAKALRAVKLFLEQVRIDTGDDAIQEQWARIWDGYVAFATTGDLGDEVAEKQRHPSPADTVAAMIRERAPIARLNHGSKQLGGKLINDLFADPPALMAALVSSGMVRPGEPEHSPFFDLTTPTGPMFRIFTDTELDGWRDWIRSLGAAAASPPTLPTPKPTIAARMQELIDTLRSRQQDNPAHKESTLIGDDPKLRGKPRTESVSWWFERPAPAFMAALAHSDWVVVGDAESSRIITELVRGNNAMARALDAKTADGSTGAETIEEWINARCPIPGVRAAARPITLVSPPERVAAHPTRHIHGSGSVH